MFVALALYHLGRQCLLKSLCFVGILLFYLTICFLQTYFTCLYSVTIIGKLKFKPNLNINILTLLEENMLGINTTGI